MKSQNPNNERNKHEYFSFLKEAKRQNDSTIDGVAKALSRFEEYTNCKDFRTFRRQQAVGFKKHLAEQKSTRTGKPLSKATYSSTLRILKAFFQWLAMQPGYKARIDYTDVEYFNPSSKDARVAAASRSRAAPTLDQVQHVISLMPYGSDIEKRDRAIVAFTLLTGCRDGATASLKLKHVDLNNRSVFQDARDVKTKASKTFPTFFFPVGDEVEKVFHDWVVHLQKTLLFGLDDPLFPKTESKLSDEGVLQPTGLKRAHWNTAGPIRRIFRKAFEVAELPYFIPHSFRKTLVALGQRTCRTPEEFKAWSQNLGHEQVLTTFTSYGVVQEPRQAEILQGMIPGHDAAPSSQVEAIAKAVVREMNST